VHLRPRRFVLPGVVHRYSTELNTLLEAPHVAQLLHRSLDVCTPQQQSTVLCSREIGPGPTSQQS